jgi:hypothetical protein
MKYITIIIVVIIICLTVDRASTGEKYGNQLYFIQDYSNGGYYVSQSYYDLDGYISFIDMDGNWVHMKGKKYTITRTRIIKE